MRILVVADGLEPLLHHTVVGLADRGHRVRVIGATSLDELDPAARDRLGARLVVSADRDRTDRRGRRARTTRAAVRTLTHRPRALADTASLLRKGLGRGPDYRRRVADMLPLLAETADVVYFEAAYVAAECASALHHLPPKIVMCTGSDVRILPEFNRHLRENLPMVFAQMSAIVCRSRDLETWAVARGAPAGRTSVVYPGVDLDVFHPDAAPPASASATRFVSVGRLHWVKGFDYAVQATHLARRAGCDIELTIVGADRGAGEPVDIAIRDLGLRDHVHRVPHCRPAEVARLLGEHHVYLVSSVGEGVSRAALEAMAVGLPVITTDAGGMPEVVTDGENGLVVPQRDPAALAAAMERLARDRDLRSAMGARAAAMARDFDAAAHLDTIEALLTRHASSAG